MSQNAQTDTTFTVLESLASERFSDVFVFQDTNPGFSAGPTFLQPDKVPFTQTKLHLEDRFGTDSVVDSFLIK